MVIFPEGGARVVSIFGHNSDVDITTTPETIWGQGGLLVPPTAARIHAIVSSSVNDASGGTGARTVKISGVDTNWAEISETVTLNGTTSVNTTNSYRFINEMRVLTAGSGGASAGNITATAATDSTVTSLIATGQTLSFVAAYAVPAGFTAFVSCYHSSTMKNVATGATGRMHLMAKGENDTLFYSLHAHIVQATGSSYVRHNFEPALPVVAKTIIRLDCKEALVNDTPIVAGFDLVLRAN